MIEPERRTRGDLLAAAAIVLAIAVTAALIWWTSDARATDSRAALEPLPPVSPAETVPDTLQQLWTAASARTTAPVVVSGAVVTADDRTLTGRDPATGEGRWSFARDRDLCGVTWVYDLAVAVYRDVRGCGQVSTVYAKTGLRGPTRTGYADKEIALSTDGSTVLAAGPTRVEMWRSDLVRTLAYGDIDAPLNPPVPQHPPCRFLSSAASSSGVALLETCPGRPEVQLRVLAVSDEDVAPEQRFTLPLGMNADSGAKVLFMSELRTAVYLPTPQPRMVVYDASGQEAASTLLPEPATPEATATRAGGLVTFWTGNSVVVLDGTSLTYRSTIGPEDVPLGPGTMMVDRLLVSVPDGIGVYDPTAATIERVIAVDRGAEPVRGTGPVTLGVLGSTVVEQRGDTVVGLGEPR